MGLLAPGSLAFADDKNKPASKPVSRLSDKENPEMIGKRNINKGSINFYSIEKEMGIGQQLSADLDRQLKFVNDSVVTEYVNRVGQNIVLNSDAKVPFTIKVVDSDEINAFALPGGFFYVNRGLIQAADNEGEIACVMAHEIAHVTARHSTEQVSKGQLLSFGSIPLIFLGGLGGILARNGANILFPLTFLKFGRNAEYEADLLGAQYAYASGYDPSSMITFFEKLESRKKSVGSVFSTHPPNPERIRAVRALVEKFPERDEYILNTSEFNRVKARLGAITASNKRQLGRDGNTGANAPSRPTLKRRGSSDPNGDPGDASADPADPDAQPTRKQGDRPTLKRRTQDPDQTPPPSSDPPPFEMSSLSSQLS